MGPGVSQQKWKLKFFKKSLTPGQPFAFRGALSSGLACSYEAMSNNGSRRNLREPCMPYVGCVGFSAIRRNLSRHGSMAHIRQGIGPGIALRASGTLSCTTKYYG
jgi:hypothetical protein